MTEPERFDAYVERCLYGPDGFYAATGTAGRRQGDFLTSPEVGPLFGAVLTRALLARWAAGGRPDPLTVYDVGCGPGTLLRTVAVALDDLGPSGAQPGSGVGDDRPVEIELVGVDRVTTGGAVRSELPDDLSSSIVVANELLDNLPFRIVEAGCDGPMEVFVADGVDVVLPLDEGDPVGGRTGRPDWIDRLEPGRRAPYLSSAAQWVADVLARGPLALIVFDYGAPTTAELADRGGWLRTYHRHRRGDDPLADPGHRDITTDVAWDQLPTPDRLETQAEFLARWGIDELVEQGRRIWRERAARPDLLAMRMRSRTVEVDALTDPDGLGGWWVATWSNLADRSRVAP